LGSQIFSSAGTAIPSSGDSCKGRIMMNFKNLIAEKIHCSLCIFQLSLVIEM
jgi:hypothetical protein